MRASLTAFGAQVLAAIKAEECNEFKSPTCLAILIGCSQRDMVNTLNWLKDLSLVDEKAWYDELLDGKYYLLTELGSAALKAHEADKGVKVLPPMKA
jgi:hypothetical protein